MKTCLTLLNLVIFSSLITACKSSENTSADSAVLADSGALDSSSADVGHADADDTSDAASQSTDSGHADAENTIDAAPPNADGGSSDTGVGRDYDGGQIGPGQQQWASSVTQYGITWTFDTDGPGPNGTYDVRQFVNGDYYVVDPGNGVTITTISRPNNDGNMDGSSINPTTQNGYDSRMGEFSAALNVANSLPLTLRAGDSLISTISLAATGTPQLSDAAVLTCLSAPATADAFRPPYCGNDKPIHTESNVDYGLLPSWEPVDGTPTMSSVLAAFKNRVWLDHGTNPVHMRVMHPENNLPDYGFDVVNLEGEAASMLLLDPAGVGDKTELARRMIQKGIDNYGCVITGTTWKPNGGQGSGRKLPILIAGLLLNDVAMLGVGTQFPQPGPEFGMDGQTFYVSQQDVDQRDYIQSDLGTPEWGISHGIDPSADTREWPGNSYRICCTAYGWAGVVLTAKALGIQDEWNHDALFDYMPRYLAIEVWPTGWHQASFFQKEMWATYWNDL